MRALLCVIVACGVYTTVMCEVLSVLYCVMSETIYICYVFVVFCVLVCFVIQMCLGVRVVMFCAVLRGLFLFLVCVSVFLCVCLSVLFVSYTCVSVCLVVM